MMTSLFQARSQKQCLFATFIITIFVLTTTTSSLKVTQVDATRNAHFTMEFIPTFKNGLPHKCHPDEIKIMETFLGDILVKETGMIEHSVEYLDNMYDPNADASGDAGTPGTAANHMKRHHFSKVRGFDFTFDCPAQGEKCPNNDWCHVLCLDESVKPGHESLTEKATQLKEKLHSQSKTLEGPYNVKCLGQTSDLDFHLLVSVSP
jgi:hypothetical protein